MLMLDRDVEVSQHSHVLNFSLLFLFYFRPELFPVPFNIVQTALDSLDRLFMKRKTGEDHTLVNVSGSDRFVCVLIIFVEQSFLNL